MTVLCEICAAILGTMFIFWLFGSDEGRAFLCLVLFVAFILCAFRGCDLIFGEIK